MQKVRTGIADRVAAVSQANPLCTSFGTPGGACNGRRGTECKQSIHVSGPLSLLLSFPCLAQDNVTSGGWNASAVAARLQLETLAIRDNQASGPGGLAEYQKVYWALIDYTPPPATNGPRAASRSVELGAGVGIGVGLPFLAALVVALWVLHRVRASQHRSLLGRVKPPGVGPATTLVVTDIQDSTVLW
jgi:hypothetical protein